MIARAFVCIAFALATTLPAAEAPKMFAARIDIPERGEVPGYLFVLGTNKFSFITPHGWKPEAKLDRREVIFIAPELDASLTVRISEVAKTPIAEEVRASLSERFPNANVTGEFNCYAASQIGWGFELKQAAAENSSVKVRYGLVPLPGATAEFILRAPSSRIRDLHLVFGRFLASFQVEGHRKRN